MTTFNKTPSKWVHYIIPVSGRRLQAFFDAEGRFLFSRRLNVSQQKAQSVPWYSRCLPHTSASSLQLFIMVHTFAFLVPERGGLKDIGARKAAIGLFEALVKKAHPRKARAPMTLELRDDWRCLWPRPSVSFELPTARVDLNFGPGDTIDLSPLFQFGDCPLEVRERRAWYNAFIKCGFHGDEEHVRVVELLGRIARSAKLEPLMAQILWRLAADFELALGEQHNCSESDIQFAWKGPISQHDPDMEMKLFGYQQAALRESERHTNLGISSDKGNPAGMTLLNTTITYANSVMVLALPTVGSASLKPTWGLWARPSLARCWAESFFHGAILSGAHHDFGGVGVSVIGGFRAAWSQFVHTHPNEAIVACAGAPTAFGSGFFPLARIPGQKGGPSTGSG